MRAIFMGTPDFSVPVLTAMKEAGHDMLAAVTQPDKPKGRGKEMQMTPVKAKALELGIPVLQPKRVRDPEFVEQLRELKPDVMVVVAFGQILTKEVLEVPKYGCINVHASLLPMYRGAAPIQYVILNGEKETGVTTMFMDEGLDTGDMLLKTVVPITADETGGTLHDKLSAAGAELLIRTLEQMEAGTLRRIPQTGETCYVGTLKKSMGEMDWSRPAEELERQVRGLNPWPSAYTFLNGKTLKIWKAEVLHTEAVSSQEAEEPEALADRKSCGSVIVISRDSIQVQTGDGILAIRELQLEGKKRMTADAFLRGYPVEAGTILGRTAEE
ncbi:MAG: methionyl-tRNA formyltransferase [Lachnospiraceae bacterium]|uniref:Methionyl-tRNA formyltransferase n=1 Tax=Hominifimenecus microfluidus TaxID=2885348 RepID=A0AAE3EBL9_9FIRM|nr:methionyl-tRNA formyltransferase [Hominifimenecus microfluidus]MCC2231001.1 methionyl-tRNA formyltransferase [Hominifimenecus microfluidus]